MGVGRENLIQANFELMIKYCLIHLMGKREESGGRWRKFNVNGGSRIAGELFSYLFFIISSF